MDTFFTCNSRETQKLGKILASELRGGEIVCLTGELGSGKTTFAQGLLTGLGAKGPYTSPTFLVMKHYKTSAKVRPFPLPTIRRGIPQGQTFDVYHIDAYRVKARDILDLGWEEIIAEKSNVVIVEWAERIRKIIPRRAIWIKFEHMNESRRKIVVKSKFQNQNFKSNPNG